jgi:hypothetical protein
MAVVLENATVIELHFGTLNCSLANDTYSLDGEQTATRGPALSGETTDGERDLRDDGHLQTHALCLCPSGPVLLLTRMPLHAVQRCHEAMPWTLL